MKIAVMVATKKIVVGISGVWLENICMSFNYSHLDQGFRICNFHDILHPGQCDGVSLEINNGHGAFNFSTCLLQDKPSLRLKKDIGTKKEWIVPTGCVAKYHCDNDFLKMKPALEIRCENGTMKSLQGNVQERDTVCTTGISTVFIYSISDV